MADWQIIPAAANTFVVYDFDGNLEAIDDVIAWRIETEPGRNSLRSTVTAITIDGDAGSNVVGVQHANGSVTLFESAKYASLPQAQEGYQKGIRGAATP